LIPHEILPTFSQLWWQAILSSAAVITVLLVYAKQLNKDQLEVMAKVVGVILIGREIFVHPYEMYLGVWTVKSSLPLQMCGLSSIMSGVILFYRRQWLYELLYFWGIPGAFHSFLTPEFTQGTHGWLFYDYFLAHGGIIFSALFCSLYLGFKPRKGSWWKIFLWTQLTLPIIGGINWLLDANYMYICEAPLVKNPFVWGKFPFHLIGFEVAGLLHFFLVYIPYGIKYRREHETPEPGVI
jgi:hypothetical integral membrane protein (TIGR02206 family)